MPVKKVSVSSKQMKRQVKARPGLSVPQNLVIPEGPKEAEDDIQFFITLIYGREGIGKTTAAATWPDPLFFSWEPGTKTLSVRDFFCQNEIPPSWDAFRRGVDILVQTPKDKRTVGTIVHDTVDRMYDLCAEYICRTRGIAHVSEDDKGKTDRSGKGWTALKKEFTDQIYRLIQSGYGVVLISHSKTVSVESASGQAYDMIAPTMPSQAFGVVRAITDFVFYLEFVKTPSGTERVIITEGDELVVAKHRGDLPKYLPLLSPGMEPSVYEMLNQSFRREADWSIDPKNVSPSKSTKAVSVIRKDQVQSARSVLRKKGG